MSNLSNFCSGVTRCIASLKAKVRTLCSYWIITFWVWLIELRHFCVINGNLDTCWWYHRNILCLNLFTFLGLSMKQIILSHWPSRRHVTSQTIPSIGSGVNMSPVKSGVYLVKHWLPSIRFHNHNADIKKSWILNNFRKECDFSKNGYQAAKNMFKIIHLKLLFLGEVCYSLCHN